MLNATELVDVSYSDEQNKNLSRLFRDFYKTDLDLVIKKTLIVEKAEYNKFLKSRTRQRTQFEATPSTIDLSFSDFSIPFEFVGTRTEFLSMDGRKITVFEELDAPCGLTKKIEIDFGGFKREFQSYFQAECYVFEEFTKEKELV